MRKAALRLRFEALDVLRGIAAVAVMLYHAGPSLRLPGLAGSGYLSVDLFFVLSGFVIAHSYEPKLASGRLGAAGFLAQRLIRLLPMIWLGTLFAVGLRRHGELGSHMMLRAIAAGLALPWPSAPSGVLFVMMPAEWSLFFELAANAVFVATFPWLRTRTLVLVITLNALLVAGGVIRLGNADGGVVAATFGMGVARVGFSFFLGVLLHRTRSSWEAKIPHVPRFPLYAGLAALLASEVSGFARIAYDLGFIFVVSPLMVMIGSKAERREGRLAIFLAMLSYPLYALHQPLQDEWAALGVPPLIGLLVLTPATAWAADAVWDRPIRAALNALIARVARRNRPTSGRVHQGAKSRVSVNSRL